MFEAGELAFRVEGNCIVFGLGLTPISRDNGIRLAACSNIWADSLDELCQLAMIRADDPVRVELTAED